jgi:orotidine-5'-phosphate decarboxylase
MREARDRILIALDVESQKDADALLDRLAGAVTGVKIGSQLFTAAGPAAVEAALKRGFRVFLDLKFHDIPNTVAGAVRAAAKLGVRLLTVHASGGQPMLEAAQQASSDTVGGSCGVLAVTVLTSLEPAVLGRAWGRSDQVQMEGEVLRLAALAAEARLHGIVCSGAEVAAVRARFGDRLAPLVPGIRLAGGDAHDQARVMTPGAAQRAGARYLILGRAVTAAADPCVAMEHVLTELRDDARNAG